MQEANTHRLMSAIAGIIIVSGILAIVGYFFFGKSLPWNSPANNEPHPDAQTRFSQYEDNKRKPMTILAGIDLPD